MKSIFPPSVASNGASKGRLRQVILGVGALVALLALAWFRAEVRSQFRSLLGRSQPTVDTSAIASAHARAAAKGATAAAKTDRAAATAAATATVADPKKSGAGVAVAQTGHPDAKTSAAPAKKGAAVAKAPAKESPKAAATEPAKDTAQGIIMREAFEYGSAGRRDPFVSLLASGELRPAISDLNLMGILYDESGRHPIAIFRDRVSNAQYRVTNGQQLGRMRVARIKPKVVVFTIEEFGMSRQDSLVLGDTTKARAK